MAIPTSPSVVVLENDVSIYTPNINSSVVGVVGFANKGPINKPTLLTSQENLIRLFGKPDTDLPGQGLEGALEILEATNQLYFVRGIDTDAVSGYASAAITVGASPAFEVSGYVPDTNPSSIFYSITDNTGATTVTAIVNVVSSTNFKTDVDIFRNAFNPDVLGDQNVIAHIENSKIYLASRFAGSGATFQLSGAAGFGFSGLGVDGNPSAIGGNNIITSGYTASNVDAIAYSVYPGAGYNLVGQRDGTTQGLSVEVNNKSARDQIAINNDGGQVESFNTIELSPSSNQSIEFVFNADIDNNQSDYIFVELEKDGAAYTAKDDFGAKATAGGFAGANGYSLAGTPRFAKLLPGTYGLAGGDSGADNTSSLIGTATLKTGLYALDDDGLNISIGVVPGISDQTVQNALVSLAESSKNFIALVAPPYGLDEVQDAINWVNGASQDVRDAALNSSYAAVYWPHVQVFNAFAGADQWYDPSIFAARQCVFTDAVSEPWFAPAGFRRGRLTKPTDTEIKLNQGDKDVLYSNSINPVVNDPTTGITIFGQRTTQRTPTALDRVNVRRLMIYIRKVLLELGKPFQFEPNDQFTWELVEGSVNPFLDDLLARRAIVEGAVKCDSTTNTPARVDRNELWCSVTIKPTKAAETIVFEVNLTSQSATIN